MTVLNSTKEAKFVRVQYRKTNLTRDDLSKVAYYPKVTKIISNIILDFIFWDRLEPFYRKIKD